MLLLLCVVVLFYFIFNFIFLLFIYLRNICVYFPLPLFIIPSCILDFSPGITLLLPKGITLWRCVDANSGHFYFLKNTLVNLIFERYYCWIYNSRLPIVFFNQFENILVFWLSCCYQEIICHSSFLHRLFFTFWPFLRPSLCHQIYHDVLRCWLVFIYPAWNFGLFGFKSFLKSVLRIQLLFLQIMSFSNFLFYSPPEIQLDIYYTFSLFFICLFIALPQFSFYLCVLKFILITFLFMKIIFCYLSYYYSVFCVFLFF